MDSKVPHSISSTANERMKYVRSLRDVRVQRREQAYLVEGVRLVEEALDAGVVPRLVLIEPTALERSARGRDLLSRLRRYQPLLVTEKVLKATTDTVTPQGVVAVVPLPAQEDETLKGPLVVVLEGLADPGNVGTILRTAWASGVIQSVAGLSCAAFYSPKTVRAGAGAHFHMQLVATDDWARLRRRLAGRRLIVAAAKGGTPYHEISWTPDAALVIGSEARGTQPEVMAAADELVHIPMQGGAESLNAAVAAGILVFAAARQILAKA